MGWVSFQFTTSQIHDGFVLIMATVLLGTTPQGVVGEYVDGKDSPGWFAALQRVMARADAMLAELE
jgi:hypothetical protein